MIDIVFYLPDYAAHATYYILGSIMILAIISLSILNKTKFFLVLTALFILGLAGSDHILNSPPSQAQAERISHMYSLLGEKDKSKHIMSFYKDRTIWEHSRDYALTARKYD